jgi:hypothetical protein
MRISGLLSPEKRVGVGVGGEYIGVGVAGAAEGISRSSSSSSSCSSSSIQAEKAASTAASTTYHSHLGPSDTGSVGDGDNGALRIRRPNGT